MPKLTKRDMYSHVLQSTLPIDDGEAKGSAFLIKHNGSTVTCTAGHVLNATPSLHDPCPQVNPDLDFAMIDGDLGYGEATFNYGNPSDLAPGDTVYYGGFPFSTGTAHVHKGTVSVIHKDLSGKRSIKIDGTAVKGMSGGPIFIQKYDDESDSYIPTIIGYLASETFDPVEKFSEALGGLIAQTQELDTRDNHNLAVKEDLADWAQDHAFITKDYFYHHKLREILDDDHHGDPLKDWKILIWRDLCKALILTDEGRLNPHTHLDITTVKEALRDAYKAYADLVLERLMVLKKQSSTVADDIDGDRLLGTIPEQPTDHLTRVGMTLVNSISTGVVTGYFIADALQDLKDFDPSATSSTGHDDEFDIGREYERLFAEEKQRNPGISDDDTHAKLINQVTRMGGTYGNMGLFVKRSKVESDHFPPSSVYKSAKDTKIRKLNKKTMASLNLRYANHRQFITTGSRKEAVEFRKRQAQFFARGEYHKAIDINLEEYEKADLIKEENKEAIISGLNVHVKNGLLNDTQKNDLIKKYNLNTSASAAAGPDAGSDSDSGSAAASAKGSGAGAHSSTGTWSPRLQAGSAASSQSRPTEDSQQQQQQTGPQNNG